MSLFSGITFHLYIYITHLKHTFLPCYLKYYALLFLPLTRKNENNSWEENKIWEPHGDDTIYVIELNS